MYVSAATAAKGGNIFKNNLWYTTFGANVATYNNAAKLEWAPADLTFGQWTSQPGETGGVSADPKFVNIGSGSEDFHLQSNSPANGAGEGGVNVGAY